MKDIIVKLEKYTKWIVLGILLLFGSYGLIQSIDYRNSSEVVLNYQQSMGTTNGVAMELNIAIASFLSLIFLVFVGVAITAAMTELVMWLLAHVKGSILSKITDRDKDGKYNLNEAKITGSIIGFVYIANAAITAVCLYTFIVQGAI